MKTKIKRKEIVECLDYNGFSFLARLVESKKIKNIDRDFLNAFTKNCKMKLAKQMSIPSGNVYVQQPQQKLTPMTVLDDKSHIAIGVEEVNEKWRLLKRLVEVKR